MNRYEPTVATKFLRLPAVLDRYGYSRPALYVHIRAGTFPPPVKLGARASAWPDHELDAIMAARTAGKSDAEIRELVSRMVAERARAFDRYAPSWRTSRGASNEKRNCSHPAVPRLPR